MARKELIVFALTLGIFVVSQGSQAQYYGRMRGLNNMHKDQCCCSYDDLTYLIALARALDEKETLPVTPSPPPPPPPQPSTTSGTCLSNFEDLIMKLVNALVYTTTETTKNTCRCVHSTPTTTTSPGPVVVPPSNGGYGSGNEMTGSSSSYYSHSDGGLLNVDVLNSNKLSNVLDVDLADRHLAGVGLGGKSNDGGTSTEQYSTGQYTSNQQTVYQNPSNQYPTTQQPSGQYPTNQQPTGQHQTGQTPTSQQPNSQQPGGKPNNMPNSDGGLINLDLLNQEKRNNVADLDVGNLNVGASLGGGGSQAPNNKGYDNVKKNTTPNSSEGLRNEDANPKKNNNLVDVDLAGKDLLGVGLG